jgi:hypothetical protein
MGYCMNQVGSKFEIKKEKFSEARDAILKLMTETNRGGAATLDAMLSELGWDCMMVDGDIADIDFNGEKLGDDGILWECLAPFVEDGSYIEMMGEDNYHWRWAFNEGKVEEKMAVVTWE